jgi:hypothetical protein
MGIVRVRERDISTYHDALMRWPIISPRGRGEGGERIGAGAKLSHAIREREAMGDYDSGFHPTSGAAMGQDGA